MKYYRVHTKDIAYITGQPRGIFTAVWKLVEAGIMNEEEVETYWKNKAYFEEVLPVPSFYDQGNPDCSELRKLLEEELVTIGE